MAPLGRRATEPAPKSRIVKWVVLGTGYLMLAVTLILFVAWFYATQRYGVSRSR